MLYKHVAYNIMKKEILRLIILFITITSCSQNTTKLREVKITSEKCKEWNLPELNITTKIPENYNLSYNEDGGFYVMARKFDDSKRLIAEITIGRIEGELKDKHIDKALKDTENGLKSQFETIEQINYTTSFNGESSINNIKLKHLRGVIEFRDFQPELEGKYYIFTAPIILDDNNKFMLSSMFREDEKLNSENIGIELLEFIDSIKLLD